MYVLILATVFGISQLGPYESRQLCESAGKEILTSKKGLHDKMPISHYVRSYKCTQSK